MRKLITLCFFLALPLFGQETYRLERIVVEGSRVSEEIVRAEARLVEEREYTEADFRQALYRIRRLPFVTDAAYRIEPGLDRGASVLVIRILDETPVFYDASVHATEDDVDHTLALGGRWMLDDLGVLETRVQTFNADDGGSVTLAYRGYGLGDRGVFVIASIEQQFGAEVRTYDPAPHVTLGLPLTQRQTLSLSASRAKSRIVTSFDVDGDDDPDDDDSFDDNIDLADRTHRTALALRWQYESHDDPLFATRGLDLSAGPFWSEQTFLHEFYDEDEEERAATEETGSVFGVSVDATAWKPIAGRNVLFLGVHGTATAEGDDRDYFGQLRGGIAHDFHLWGDQAIRPWRARVEVAGSYWRTEDDASVLADAAFVLRNRWGTLRLAGSYIWQ